jgi:hypothetical protein
MMASSFTAKGAIPNLAEAGLTRANINKETVAIIHCKYFTDLFLRRVIAPVIK